MSVDTRPGAKVLVTGGAGFIGSHVVDLLLEKDYEVVVFDKLVKQVHGNAGPQYVPDEVQFIWGDVQDRDALRAALDGVSHIVHLAAEVGVGQSMYEISRYVDGNTGGTAVMLDVLANERHSVGTIVVASSMSIYGEGAYVCSKHGPVAPVQRAETQLAERNWDLHCQECRRPLLPTGTPESKPLHPSSVYAISKMDQELLCLSVGAAYGLDVVALRYFNSYGPRQALSNPYTGVAAIFSSRLMNGRSPLAFEDGQQLRDFIHVRDVARATVAALETPEAAGETINVGVGDPLTIEGVAATLAEALGVEAPVEITGKFRAGDIRHCYADMTKAEEILGFRAEISFQDGVRDLIEWVSAQTADDRVGVAREELERHGLAR